MPETFGLFTYMRRDPFMATVGAVLRVNSEASLKAVFSDDDPQASALQLQQPFF
jgi:hypothetical protein